MSKFMNSFYVLVVAVLTTQSSYKDETEIPAQQVPDTIQFWFAPESVWRVRTFAIDHDIHVYQLGVQKDDKRFEPKDAINHIHKNYADILGSIQEVAFSEPLSDTNARKVLLSAGLPGLLEYGKGAVAFYNPDGARYWSQSSP